MEYCRAPFRPVVCTLGSRESRPLGHTVNRRAFARALSESIASLTMLPSVVRASAEYDSDTLVLGIVSPSQSPLFQKGIAMGIQEAARTGSLFQKKILSHDLAHTTAGNVQQGIAQLASRGAHAVVACVAPALVDDTARACEKRGLVFVNCGARSDALRRSLCLSKTFHVEASDAMYSDAAKQSSAKRIALWDSRLERYGAAQLNDRFRQFAGQPMDSSAWAGWVAVKILWESFLHSPASPATWMSSDHAEFDGHKGAPLSFRSWDHQLRQPLYSIADRVSDVPDIGRSTLPARELLDRIGDHAGVQLCAKRVS
jgi:hypothetical protein